MSGTAALAFAALLSCLSIVASDELSKTSRAVVIDVLPVELMASPPGANWLSYNGDFSGRRFSSLAQINPANVGQLRAQWVFHSRVLRCREISKEQRSSIMTSTIFNRRKLMTSFAAVMSALGAGALLSTSAQAKGRDANVRKLNRDGKPADGKQMITALITHNGLLYIAGQGANSNGPVGKDDIDSHTTKVMENVKGLVETGGGSMDSILQLTVYLANLDYYEPMNKIFKTYFPNGGPARTTVAVAALPGNSMLEINCIAAIVRK